MDNIKKITQKKEEIKLELLKNSYKLETEEFYALLGCQKTLFETSKKGLALIDEDTGRIIMANEAFKKITGYSEVTHKNLSFPSLLSCLNPENKKYADMKELMATQEFYIFNRDKKKISIKIRKNTELFNNTFAVAILDNQTVKEYSPTMEEPDIIARLKQEFMATITHELKTPLNDILGMSAILLEKTCGSLNEKQETCIKNIKTGGKKLLSMIGDILDINRIASGKLQIEISPVSVEALLCKALKPVRKAADKKKITFREIQDRAVTEIETDGRRLKQILTHLLNNAIKFTPEGGEISLEVKGDMEDNSVAFTVRDRGTGIPREYMEYLFMPLVQLESKLSRRYPGIGIGLTFVQYMTDLLGGGVFLESEAGKGSAFTVKLPWRKNIKIDVPFVEKISSHSSKQKLVLIAEDNEIILRACSDYLEFLGYRVRGVCNGEEAIREIKKEKPDIIVIDIQMPGMNGLETIRKIRKNDVFRHIPVIALTALAIPGARDNCIKAGANEFMEKPTSLKMLAQIIEKLLKT